MAYIGFIDHLLPLQLRRAEAAAQTSNLRMEKRQQKKEYGLT